MEAASILAGIIVILLLILIFLIRYIVRSRRQLRAACAVLDEIAVGNPNRRIIAEHGTMAADVCYKINEIVIAYREQLLAHEKSEQAYKRLITSLSHDIRTPLATLTGYLEAVASGIVADGEKDEYLSSALRKASDLKRYLDVLFEWLKLESGERTYQFERIDICELSRNVIADFIPAVESWKIAYEFHIPEAAIWLSLDRSGLSLSRWRGRCTAWSFPALPCRASWIPFSASCTARVERRGRA